MAYIKFIKKLKIIIFFLFKIFFFKESNYVKHDFLSLFDNLDDIDIELLDTFALTSFRNKPKMNDETFINMRKIEEKTDQLERERRGYI